jgi:hypothetical protein
MVPLNTCIFLIHLQFLAVPQLFINALHRKVVILDKKFILELCHERIGRKWVVQPKLNLLIYRANIDLLIMKIVSEDRLLLLLYCYILFVATGYEYLFQ